MLRKVQWSGFPIIANLFKGKLLHCEGASSRGGCRATPAQRAPGGAHRAKAVMVAASPGGWLQNARTHVSGRRKKERKKGWVSLPPRSSARSLGTLVASGSWARPERSRSEERRLCPRARVLPGAGAWCFSYEDRVLLAHLFHLKCISILLWGYFVEGKEGTGHPRLPRGGAGGSLQGPGRSRGEPPLPRVLGCAQPQTQKLGRLQLCALTGTL